MPSEFLSNGLRAGEVGTVAGTVSCEGEVSGPLTRGIA